MDHDGHRERWILITGGSRGIGRGMVEAFARAGWTVAFTYRSEDAAARAVEDATHAVGRPAKGFRCDSTDEAQVTALASELLAERGAPHGIIANAGITRDALLMQMSTSQWHDVLRTNLDGAFYITRAFVQAMSDHGDGVVLLMSSVAGQKGIVGQTNYATTKAGLQAFARALALETARFGVRVNAIAPGYIATDMVDEMPEVQRKAIRNRVPLRRIGDVGDVANLALFLVSENATYITGQTLVVDGGLTV